MDAFGHLNNAAYFTCFEQARVSWLQSLGMEVSATGEEGIVIVSASCNFRRPVVYPATVEVRMYGGQPGRSSFPTWYELEVTGDAEGDLRADGEAVVVWTDQRTGRARPVPGHVRALLPGS